MANNKKILLLGKLPKLYIYIYIYRERERERESSLGLMGTWPVLITLDSILNGPTKLL